MEHRHLISHELTQEPFALTVEKVNARIIAQGDKPYISVQQQLDIVQQLAAFDLGRFLLQNQGLNGYWTHYILSHPFKGRISRRNNQGKCFTALENYLLNSSPVTRATQERYEIFLRENQKMVKEGARLASIPCGLMSELLYLKIKNHVESIHLVGIDLDPHALHHAQKMAEARELTDFVELHVGDAWNLDTFDAFDLLSSNGLIIYEPNEQRVEQLYRLFYKSLKFGGKLVSSFMTPPPTATEHCEWNMAVLKPYDLLLQKIIMVDVIDAKFQCYSSTETTRHQLLKAGFSDIQFFYDRARIFPTVVAVK